MLGVQGSDFNDIELLQSSDYLPIWEGAFGELISNGLIEEKVPPGDAYILTDEA